MSAGEKRSKKQEVVPTEQQILSLIRKITPESNKYLHDDAVVIEKNWVVTTDSLVENTHFTLDTYTQEEIGWKAIAVNLSDIAAMGAKPLYAVVSLTLPQKTKLSFIKNLYRGIINCSRRYKTKIIGGNLSRGKEINITITMVGKLISRNIPTRSNSRPGDLVFTTGTFGDSAFGYLLLKSNKILVKKQKLPIPHIYLGQKIVRLTKRVALMDASDGLADCLIQLSNESKVKILVEENKIPLSTFFLKTLKLIKKNKLNLSLYGGEDYQLIGTASKNDIKKLLKINKIKIIGEVQKGTGAFLKKNDGKIVKLNMKKVFKHFT